MNDHIAKPIDPQVLFAALLQWIEPGERELPDTLQAPKESSLQEETLPELPGIDTEAGLARMAGNIRSYRKLLNKFVANQEGAIGEIRAAFGEGDHEGTVRLAHTLKGVAGSIGALALQTAGADLEAALKDQPETLPETLIEEAGTQLAQIIAAIQSIAAVPAQRAAQGGNSGTSADMVSKLHGLLESLERYDAEAEDVLEDILGQVSGAPLVDPLQDLKKRVGQYDFEGAAEDLKQLIASLDVTAGADPPSSSPSDG